MSSLRPPCRLIVKYRCPKKLSADCLVTRSFWVPDKPSRGVPKGNGFGTQRACHKGSLCSATLVLAGIPTLGSPFE